MLFCLKEIEGYEECYRQLAVGLKVSSSPIVPDIDARRVVGLVKSMNRC